jgi:hypothetical protein
MRECRFSTFLVSAAGRSQLHEFRWNRSPSGNSTQPGPAVSRNQFSGRQRFRRAMITGWLAFQESGQWSVASESEGREITLHAPRLTRLAASRKSGSFASPIPLSFALSHTLPMTNTRAIGFVLDMVQTQVTAQGWLGSTPEERRPQIGGWRAGARSLLPARLQPPRSCHPRRSGS